MPNKTIPVASLGFPRIGRHRELKFALEGFWSGKIPETELLETAARLRAENWVLQREKGITHIPSNDFSLYDHVLDTAVMVGAIPSVYGWEGEDVSLSTYFAMARGSQSEAHAGCGHAHGADDLHGLGVRALEMTKWFDTNYHYMVPEVSEDQHFVLTSQKPVEHFLEAKALGIHTRPVILGPVTFLKLAKAREAVFKPLDLLAKLLPVYEELLRRLHAAGADWVQIDEPVAALDLSEGERHAFTMAYQTLSKAAPDLKILVATYFGGLEDNLETIVALPVAGLHIDLVRASNEFEAVLKALPANRVLSLGVIDGRNIWRADLAAIVDRLEAAIAARGVEAFQIAPSCSLLHVPVDLELETGLDADLKSWLSFAAQKLGELATLGRALGEGKVAVAAELGAASKAAATRASSPKVTNTAVQKRIGTIGEADRQRTSAFAERQKVQAQAITLPLFPTTTIGSFPQTLEVRKARSAHAKGALTDAQYEGFLQKETEATIRWQEEIGLDVLVHGEFERNDMVQYFGEQLSGFAFTQHAWVQSYGSRYVRPPIIFGDVSRPKPMTVRWWEYSQSLTDKPVKGMLTGPVTILNWSFVRDDIARSLTCRQIALAIRDEVNDLEAAGAQMIQIDEAALREGLPLRHRDWQHYLGWAVECFRICSSGVGDHTQVHTHMCYSEFNQIIDAIAAMDADVISIETSRSKMELLDAFRTYKYPNQIGPGVYDIHSPRVPAVGEMVDLLALARERLDDRQLWINPDCGLKTRKWEEVRPALVNMVAAAAELRRALPR
ncbi:MULTISPECIES: 5-methyltetrahydropteroyltriglutamate--homocysteine S-methyltransferase [unclassified Agrobacterium]|uniref:5-methyltetrahydropteroyltriglutamate-- homocysteine S-methyltransferase n=1 Tax=unclassified Agrobacterium TaxID=2632611 RepID=UPI0006997130|nr:MULTISPECIES: 5-methyltetrahydropteroyltriglutamate--homocysteine S-methyltransferase [unclassified Agrobacterium]KNY33264.1 5-methyltetrahydropteroyltriglutamate--homocysteine methyltransferase [Agrobacterium sp. SUL3]MCD4662413.1 5-methyltetrahydropteroyltriglutamate--homocysteine S-methyltransferase [Agrobacterium sp.]